MDTSLGLRRVRRTRAEAWILSLWVLLFAAFVLPSPAEAQKGPRKRAAAERRAEKRGEKGAEAGAPVTPRLTSATPKIALTPRPPRAGPTSTALTTLWKQAVDALASAYAARHPDRSLQAARGQPGSFELGPFGSPASLRWRDALADALVGLGRLQEARGREGLTPIAARLADWIELELLLLDTQAASSRSPASYLRRAADTLRAAHGALWMKPEERQAELARIVAALPAYLRDARISLVSPAPDELDVGLLELEDLRELLRRVGAIQLGPSPPGPNRGQAPAPQGQATVPALDPETALDGFRAWLQELRESAGGQPSRLDPGEWQRCLLLATGTSWGIGELKARALRELARLDLEGAESHRERPRRPSAEELARQVGEAAAQAARLGLATHVLRDSLEPGLLEFRAEPSARADWHELVIRPAAGGRWIGTLALPHPAWSPARSAARLAALRLEHAAALGVRYGLAGEAYWAALMRAERDVPPMLLDDRLVREGLGLYALEWTSRLEHDSNPFRANEAVARAFARQRGREAARLLATLELHAEGVSEREARLTFARRTGADDETARTEIRAALRDPLHGIAYLGLLEVLALEQRLREFVEPHRAPRLVLLSLARNPGLRPADLAVDSALAARDPSASAKKPGEALEIPGPSQQEQPRSR